MSRPAQVPRTADRTDLHTSPSLNPGRLPVSSRSCTWDGSKTGRAPDGPQLWSSPCVRVSVCPINGGRGALQVTGRPVCGVCSRRELTARMTGATAELRTAALGGVWSAERRAATPRHPAPVGSRTPSSNAVNPQRGVRGPSRRGDNLGDEGDATASVRSLGAPLRPLSTGHGDDRAPLHPLRHRRVTSLAGRARIG